MKKNVICLLSLLCSLSLFTACSDDDDDNKPEPKEATWADYAGEYGDKNTLLLNGTPTAKGTLSAVTISAGSNDKARIVITNVFPEKPVLEIDGVEMTEKDGTYAFTGEAQAEESIVSFTGILTPGTVAKAVEKPAAKLSINTSRKVTSNLVGTWALNYKSEEIADFRVNVKTDHPEVDILLPIMAAPAVGGLIGGKVEAVTVEFKENGVFDFSWRPVGASADVTLMDIISSVPAMAPILDQIKSLLTLQYMTNRGNLYIVIDKQAIALLSAMKDFIPVDLETVMGALLQNGAMLDQGAYYMLSLKMTDNEEGVRLFGADKRLTLPALNIALGMLNWDELKNLPALEPWVDTIEAMLAALPTAETFDIGLGFTKK